MRQVDCFVRCGEAYSEVYKDHYLAGLWLQDLIHTLGWSTTDWSAPGTPLKPRPAVYRAPTWSWASTGSEISFPSLEIDEPTVHRCISILGYHIEASAEHQFGEDTGGTVTLSCEILLPCKFGSKAKDTLSASAFEVGKYWANWAEMAILGHNPPDRDNISLWLWKCTALLRDFQAVLVRRSCVVPK
jgi:hypothetical protein